MAQAKRDGNYVPAALGMSDTDSSNPLPIQIDSLTGRVLIAITNVASSSGTLPAAPAERDQNYVAVGMGVSDADGTTPIPIMMDSRNNLLYCDVLIEP